MPRLCAVAPLLSHTFGVIFMEFFENTLYHIYNRGNNQQQIFFKPDNYLFFLNKVRKFILPHCDILCYCLMPNHFHFLINSDHRTVSTKVIAGKEKIMLSEGIRMLLSSYTLAINKQNDTTGSLFQQNTKAKSIAKGKNQYDVLCFHYSHQNPMRAKLVEKMEHWEYSSFRDYCGFRNGTLCNQAFTVNILGINKKTFYNDSYKIIREDDVKHIL